LAFSPSQFFNDLLLFDCVPNGFSLVKSLEVLHKLGFDFEVQYRTHPGDGAAIKLPITAKRRSNVVFDCGHPILPPSVSLTSHQQAAVLSALFFPLTLIVGPPGTGKTETVLAITRVLYRNFRNLESPDKILCCAHSNAALDQMLLEIASSDEFNIFRFGSSPSSAEARDLTAEARICDALADLQRLLKANSSWLSAQRYSTTAASLQRIAAEILAAPFSQIKVLHKRYSPTFAEALPLLRGRGEIGDILDRLADDYSTIVRQLARNALIVGCTITSLSQRFDEVRELGITAVIVEEAAKVLETEMLIFLALSPARLILVGDQAQLRPIVASDDVRFFGRFSQSLFERLQRLGVRAVALNKQGRSISPIADLYRRRYADPLSDLKVKIPDIPFIDRSVQWVDVQAQPRGETNEDEAEFVREMLRRAKLTGRMNLRDVSVLTPYNAQKALLIESLRRDELLPRDVCTVDEFQGKQNLVIVISLVAYTPSLFMRDERRITVLVSRARSRLIIFGNRAGFGEVPEWRPIIECIEKANRLAKLCLDRKCYSRAADMLKDNDALAQNSRS
jgi:DNA polymerase III delta prime subunit